MSKRDDDDTLKQAQIAALPPVSELVAGLSKELELRANLTRRGRPEKLDTATVSIMARCFERGLTLETTAHVIGVHPDTLRKWKRENNALGQLIEHSRAKGKMFVVSKAFAAVDRGNVSMIKFWLSRNVEGFQAPAIMDRQGSATEDTVEVVGFKYTAADKKERKDVDN